MSKVQEALDLLQEECGELVVAISKCRRFGLEENRANLIQEIGDIELLIDFLIDSKVFQYVDVQDAKQRKFIKLLKWSTLYDDQE